MALPCYHEGSKDTTSHSFLPSQDTIVSEHERHGDVLQHDFLDSYANLTMKTAFMLKWLAAGECAAAKFVMKVDDDAFVNPAVLWAALEHAPLFTTSTRQARSTQ